MIKLSVTLLDVLSNVVCFKIIGNRKTLSESIPEETILTEEAGEINELNFPG